MGPSLRKTLVTLVGLALLVGWGAYMLRPSSRSLVHTAIRTGTKVLHREPKTPAERLADRQVTAAKAQLAESRDRIRRLPAKERQRLARPLWDAMVARSAAAVTLDDLTFASPERRAELSALLTRQMQKLKDAEDTLKRDRGTPGS